MADEKNLKDNLDNMLGDAKENANAFAEDAKNSANEFANNARETFGSGRADENKKVLAGVLALLIGSLGVHKFILGYNKEGIIQIIASVVTCGIAGVIPFIEGIIYLTKTDEEFYNTYQVGKKPWF